MKIDKRKPMHWLWLGIFSLNTLLSLILRLFVKSPSEVVLYGHKLNGNLKAIYKESDNHEELNPYYLSMDYYYCKELKRDGVNVVWGGSWYAILLLVRTKIIVSDHGLHCLILLLKFTAIKFVDVWHGIPFKGFDKDDFKVQRQYDEVWVTSPYIADLYQNKFGFERDKIKIIGYARTDRLVNKCDHEISKLREQLSLPQDKTPVVLFAPTWAHDNKDRSIFPFCRDEDEFLNKLNYEAQKNGYIIVVRRHMNSWEYEHKGYSHIRNASSKHFPDAEMLLMIADVLVYDWSSIVFDYLLLDRAVICLDVPPPFSKGLSLDNTFRYGVFVNNMEELSFGIQRKLSSFYVVDAVEAEKRKLIRECLYGDIADGNCSIRACKRLVSVLHY